MFVLSFPFLLFSWQRTIKRLMNIASLQREQQKQQEEWQKSADDDADEFNDKIWHKRFGVSSDHQQEKQQTNTPTGLLELLALKHGKKPTEPVDRLMRLLRQAIRLGYSLTGRNGTDMEHRTFRTLSPRFLSVIPQQEEHESRTVRKQTVNNGDEEGE